MRGASPSSDARNSSGVIFSSCLFAACENDKEFEVVRARLAPYQLDRLGKSRLLTL